MVDGGRWIVDGGIMECWVIDGSLDYYLFPVTMINL
jgi:hypothetical protein